MSENSSTVFCVAAYESAPTLPVCLKGIASQDPLRILVVDDGSTDETAVVAAGWEGVEVVRLDTNRGVGAARNAALENLGDCDFVAIVDSDIELENGWLRTLQRGCDWTTFSAACGRVRAAADGHHWAATLDEAETSLRFGDEPKELAPPWRQVMYFNYLFKREVFDDVGTFDPRFRTNAEDSDFFYRCAQKGHRFYYVPQARAIHRYAPPSFGVWLKRKYRNGFYTIQFHLKNRTPLLAMKIFKLAGLIILGMTIFGGSMFGDLWLLEGVVAAFVIVGLGGSFRLGWKPVLGGWIEVIGWLAKALGELAGVIAYV